LILGRTETLDEKSTDITGSSGQLEIRFGAKHHLGRFREHEMHPPARANQAFEQTQAIECAGGASHGQGDAAIRSVHQPVSPTVMPW
jgi:hypothetical protein